MGSSVNLCSSAARLDFGRTRGSTLRVRVEEKKAARGRAAFFLECGRSAQKMNLPVICAIL